MDCSSERLAQKDTINEKPATLPGAVKEALEKYAQFE